MQQDAVVDAQSANFEVCWAHRRAENINDIDAIMDTVTLGRPRYVIVEADKPIQVLQDRDSVRHFYTAARAKGSRGNGTSAEGPDEKRLITDWYMFVEMNAHFMFDGEFEGVDRTGMEYSVPTATFLPADERGILGEFLWWPRSLIDGVAAAAAGQPLDHIEVGGGPRIQDQHDRFVLALQGNDAKAIRSLVSDGARLVTRDYDDADGRLVVIEGGDAVVDYYSRQLAAAPRVTVNVLSLVSTPWYAFAEYLWSFLGDDVDRTRRVAAIYSRDDEGRLHTSIGYGSEELPVGALGTSYGHQRF